MTKIFTLKYFHKNLEVCVILIFNSKENKNNTLRAKKKKKKTK